MRQGMNPLREKPIPYPLPPDVPVVCVITHLPNEHGYHKDRRDIVLQSIAEAKVKAGMPHCFVIFDNGSSDEFAQELTRHNADTVILSRNIGISNAMRRVLSMYQDCIVALANDDIFYEQDWLVKQVEILKAYPNVGTVSGVTTRFYMGKAVEATEAWVKREGLKITGHPIPPLWDEQHGLSVGKLRHAHLQEFGTVRAPLVEYNGVPAIIGGNHCQFVCYANRILPLLPNSDRYMAKLFPFDMTVNAAGYLRLLTPERTARHVGNVNDD
jgi:glycosyltransferase involved in cell wall biosynthesis